MFGKKTKENALELKDSKTPEAINYSDNIFKELSGDLDFGKEEVIKNNPNEKSKEYYLKLSLTILGIVNIILVLLLIGSIGYVKVQNNSDYYSKSFLDPFCFIILGNDLKDKNKGDYCSSISSLIKDYTEETEKLKTEISVKMNSIIPALFTIENFKNSPEVAFLINNKMNKLRILDMLNDFDKLKNDFSAGDKKLVKCSGVSIEGNNILKTECEVYSSSWDRAGLNGGGIIGDSGDVNAKKIDGTSMSTAASFLNFIEKNPSYNFQLIEKQKTFNSSSMVGEGPYVKMTKVQLQLKYNNLKNNLSF